MFAGVIPILSEPRLYQDDVGYPVLSGNYQGFDVVLEPVLDQMSVRKLPTLWLKATVRAAVPYDGVFDYLVRPAHTEFYSPSDNLPEWVQVPGNWPQHASIRTDKPSAMPPFEIINSHMNFFQDDKAKELLITQHGVRLVYLLGEATRSVYLLLRQPCFEQMKVSRDLVTDILDRAIALVVDLTQRDESKIPV